MDIVTHGMMGLVIAGPFLGTETAVSAGFVMGCVVPDLDALSRCFGKRAFLEWHQGWTHSLPVISSGGLLGWLGLKLFAPEWSGLAVGIAGGAAFHSLLDLANTFGVRILAPFSMRRFCWEWLFFIDSVVITLTIAALIPVLSSLLNAAAPPILISGAYCVALGAYIGIKAGLKRRAHRLWGAAAVAVIPSALTPWMFYVCERSGNEVRSWLLNALIGSRRKTGEVRILDAEFRQYVESLPEFRAMAALSPAYHVVECTEEADRKTIRCRDLRIVNFKTSFGMLDVTFGPQFTVETVNLHV